MSPIVLLPSLQLQLAGLALALHLDQDRALAGFEAAYLQRGASHYHSEGFAGEERLIVQRGQTALWGAGDNFKIQSVVTHRLRAGHDPGGGLTRFGFLTGPSGDDGGGGAGLILGNKPRPRGTPLAALSRYIMQRRKRQSHA